MAEKFWENYYVRSQLAQKFCGSYKFFKLQYNFLLLFYTVLYSSVFEISRKYAKTDCPNKSDFDQTLMNIEQCSGLMI